VLIHSAKRDSFDGGVRRRCRSGLPQLVPRKCADDAYALDFQSASKAESARLRPALRVARFQFEAPDLDAFAAWGAYQALRSGPAACIA